MTHETGPTGHAPTGISPRAVAAGGLVLLLVFVALAVWALQDPNSPGDDLPPTQLKGRKVAPEPKPPPTSSLPSKHPEPQARPPDAADSHLIKPPRDVSKLLNQKFQFTRQDGAAAFAQLRSALGPERVVTVVNVWAPYCEPCKREFPAFRALQADWGDAVRFMPIQLGEGDPGPLADIMPAAPHHLIDFIPGGAVQGTLAELGLLPDHAPIPITLVLDCRHQLRWLSAREVTDIDGFARVVADLRRELDTPACTRSSAASAPTPAHCGNGLCEPREYKEDCLSCPADCGCRRGQLCASQTGGRLGHVCMDELQ